jgi:hypothetical protein
MNRFIGSSPIVTTNNYYTIADIHNLQSLYSNPVGIFPLVFTIRFLARVSNIFTVNKSFHHTLILLWSTTSQFSNSVSSLVWILATVCRYIDTARTTQKTVLLLRNVTTGYREPSSHCCLLDCLQNCCLATSCNIRYNSGLPIVVMQY